MSEPQLETPPRSGHPFTDGYFAELQKERNSLRRELDAVNELLRSTLQSDMPVVERLRAQLAKSKKNERTIGITASHEWLIDWRWKALEQDLAATRAHCDRLFLAAKKYAGPKSGCCLDGEATGEVCELHQAIASYADLISENIESSKFTIGDKVVKLKGSAWSGTVVGTYSTELTPEGYCVESDMHKGSVQIYPASALEKVIQP